jgi:hypothetical protein
MSRLSIRAVTIGAVLSLGSVVALGCGDDALSEDEFVGQANDICEEGNARLDTLAEEVEGGLEDNEPAEDLLEDFAGQFVDEVRGQVEAIRELDGPGDLEDELNPVLDDADGILDQIEEDPSVFTSEGDPFEDVNARLDELGLTECAGS